MKLFKRKPKKEKEEKKVRLDHKTGFFCNYCEMPIHPEEPASYVSGKKYHKRCLRKMKKKAIAFKKSGNFNSMR